MSKAATKAPVKAFASQADLTEKKITFEQLSQHCVSARGQVLIVVEEVHRLVCVLEFDRRAVPVFLAPDVL